MLYIIRCAGRRWKVRQAVSLEKACQAITTARVSGSIGASLHSNGIVEADVIQINSDGTERRAYSEAY